jgi:molybdopterin/thiamine biosynthesis adenylyltransferase
MIKPVDHNRVAADKKVVVVGAGGNIGSHLVPHLARMPGVGRVTLIDRDTYESKNLSSQDISPGDVGKPKASVQARKLRRVNHTLAVEPICDALERVPLGKFRADVILACLDSRIARQRVSQFAWRLGVPLIDAGVEPTGLLARVNVYVPSPDNPCMECAWDDRDYEALEQTYPCAGFAYDSPATNAPSSLGALAAALQAIECQKLLSGHFDRAAAGRQVLIDAAHHKHYVTVFRRNASCRFAGHEIWKIERLNRSPGELTLAEALSLSPVRADNAKLRVESKPFVKRLTCSSCGYQRACLRLECSLSDRFRRCARCGAQMVAAGFDMEEDVSVSSLDQRSTLTRSVRSLGFRSGEVFTIRQDGVEFHYELGD